jgi:ribosomal protein L11 methyltransferase
MRQDKTHELRIAVTNDRSGLMTKELVKAWLMEQGVMSFVEGVVDSLDLDHEFGLAETTDLFEQLGGDTSPMSVYKYVVEPLEDLRVKIGRAFPQGVTCSMHSMETKEWLDGWKDSFKPFNTDHFCVFPPWEKTPAPADKIPLKIEPAAAFGTGQHATTRLCMRQLERIADEWTASGHRLADMTLLDVGAGTGILAIGAKLLGFGAVLATDIDDDAVAATRSNAALNGLDFPVLKASVPKSPTGARPHDLVLANILAVVLAPLLPELAQVTAPSTGRLVLSGILAEDSDVMIHRAAVAGLVLTHSEILDDWIALVFSRKA